MKNAIVCSLAAALAAAAVGCWDLDAVKLADPDGGDADTDSDSDSDSDSDTGGPPDIEGITATPQCTGTGQTITFTAQTTGEISSYSWDFGDSVTSEDAAPSHFYAHLGTYDVSLTVSGPDGDDTLELPGMIRIIEEGWTRLNPAHFWGDVVDIWASPDSSDYAWAATASALIRWDDWGSQWEEVPVDGLEKLLGLSSTSSSGSHAMVYGKDEDNIPRIFGFDGSDMLDADPDTQLPHTVSDNYLGVHMTWWDRAVLAIQTPSDGVKIFSYYSPAASNPWTEVTAPVANPTPNWADDFGIAGPYGDWRMYLLQNGTIYVSDYYNGTTTSLAWYPSTAPSGCTLLLAIDAETVWCAGAGGVLQKAIIDGGTPMALFTDIAAGTTSWTANHEFLDLAIDGAGTTIYATAVDSTVTPAEAIIVKITDIEAAAPTIELMDTTSLMWNRYDAQVAAYDDESVWFGSANSFIARNDGTVWENTTGAITTGYMGIPRATADGHVYLASAGTNPLWLLDHDGEEWLSTQIPDSLGRPGVVWPAASDDIWVFGQDDAIARFNGIDWQFDTLGTGASATINAAWGSSPDDIWAVGGIGGTTPVVVRYNGSGWANDVEAEEILGGTVYAISGSGADSVYAVSEHGILARFDGTSWEQVTHTLFDAPDLFGLCTDTAASDCEGAGWGFAGMFVSAVEGGVFAALVEGEYEMLYGAEANCPGPSDGRCVLDPAGEEFMATMPVFFDGTSWTSLELPSDLFSIDPTDEIMVGLWAAGDNEAYTMVFGENSATEEVEAFVISWNGDAWTALPEQPASLQEYPFFMTGARSGELFGLGMESEAIMRYQTCDVP